MGYKNVIKDCNKKKKEKLSDASAAKRSHKLRLIAYKNNQNFWKSMFIVLKIANIDNVFGIICIYITS